MKLVNFNELPQRHQKGFTLLEILLAVFIFALISTGAYQLSTVAQKNAVSIKASNQRLRDISLSFEIIEKDLTQIVARAWRDPYGDAFNPPLQTDLNNNYVLRLVRSGWRNPLGTNRSDQQVVTYLLKDDKLQRLYNLHLDNISSIEAVETDLLNKVTQIELTFFARQSAANAAQNTMDRWPPISTNPANNTNTLTPQAQITFPLPLAIEVTLELEDMGRISKIITLAAGA